MAKASSTLLVASLSLVAAAPGISQRKPRQAENLGEIRELGEDCKPALQRRSEQRWPWHALGLPRRSRR